MNDNKRLHFPRGYPVRVPSPVPHSKYVPIASLLKHSNKDLSVVLASATSPECDVDVHVLSPPVLAVRGGGVDIDYVWGRCTHDDALEKNVHRGILKRSGILVSTGHRLRRRKDLVVGTHLG